jgi:transcriptional regulator with XRE-family HTH domain
MNKVREARLKAHMSQDELAEKSGLARPTISKIERGETVPSGLSRQKIADALSTPMWEVFPDDGTESIEMPERDIVSRIMGIAVVNGTMAAAGVRGTGSGQVAVKEPRIEGFLIDRTGERCSNMLVHLIHDGEKIDTTVSGRQGRFVFKDIKPGDYVLLAEDRFQAVSIDTPEEAFDFEL